MVRSDDWKAGMDIRIVYAQCSSLNQKSTDNKIAMIQLMIQIQSN